MKRHARQKRILAILIAAAAAAAPAHAGWQAHYSPEGISATGFFENFGGGGEGTRIERSPARRINLGSIGSTQWAPEAPAAGTAPVNALHEETVRRFRHAGIGGDNTPDARRPAYRSGRAGTRMAPHPRVRPLPMPGPIEPDSSRLRLRQWREDDLTPFAALSADPDVMAHFPATLQRRESDALARRCQTLIAERGWGFWAAELKESGAFIGFVGLHVPLAELPFSPCVEVGWRLARAYWGQGLATEAACAALRVGFETLELQEIVSFTTLGNLRSRAVMERIGMRRTDEDFDHPAVPPGSPLRAHCLYRLDRDGWQKQRG